MGKKGFYHLFSDGFRTDVLFEDRPAFIAAMNIVAVCCFRCKITILAFCLMDNHVHFILYGTMEECLLFKDKFLHKYAIWHSKRHSGRKLEAIDFDIKLMEDERYILTSIAYVLRNCIAAGFRYCAIDYPWSSAGLYFRDPESLKHLIAGWSRLSDMPVKERYRILQTQMDIPSDWIITPEGYVWPGSYVNYWHVEQLFKTPKSFTYFMGQGKEEEINKSLGMEATVQIPDMELREKATVQCLRMFKTTNMRRLDAQRRIELAKVLRKEYKCSAKQIARIVHLDSQYIKELT